MFEAPWHWVIVALVALILFFGWKQLPDMARSLGRSLRVFKTEIKGMTDDDRARDSARESAKPEPAAIEAPRPTVQAADLDQSAARPAPRPRPAPNPNGRAESARVE